MDLYLNKLEQFEKEVKMVLKTLLNQWYPNEPKEKAVNDPNIDEEIIYNVIKTYKYEITNSEEAMQYLMYWDVTLQTSLDLAYKAGYESVKDVNSDILATQYLRHHLKKWWEQNKLRLFCEV